MKKEGRIMKQRFGKTNWRRATSLIMSLAIAMTLLVAASTDAAGREETGFQIEDFALVATPETFIRNGSAIVCKVSFSMPPDLDGYDSMRVVLMWPNGLRVTGLVTLAINGGTATNVGTATTTSYTYSFTGSAFDSIAGASLVFTLNYQVTGWTTGMPMGIRASLQPRPAGGAYEEECYLTTTVRPRLWDAGPVTVLYAGTGATGGTPPVDANSPYKAGDSVEVLGNTGGLVRTGSAFAGWVRDIMPLRIITEYAPGDVAAGWAITGTGEPGHEITVRYYRSNSTLITQTSSGNPLTNITTVVGDDGRWTYIIPGWLESEAAGWSIDGGYTAGQPQTVSRAAGDTFEMLHGNITFRPIWGEVTEIPYKVTYKANGGTGADVVVDVVSGQLYTVAGNTAFTAPAGYKDFAGWNTKADGTGVQYAPGEQFTITGDIDLYAVWLEDLPVPITSIKIDAEPGITVVRWQTYYFKVILNDGAVDDDIIWSVSDTRVAIVDNNGVLKVMNSTGMVVLTATDPVSGLSHSIHLRVV